MDPFALEGLAMALVRKGRIDEAADHLCTAVRLRPDDAEARFNLGSALMHLGRFDQAAQELRAADRIRPGDVDIVYSLGVALANTHRIDEAVQSFKAAIAMRPTRESRTETWPRLFTCAAISRRRPGSSASAKDTARRARNWRRRYQPGYGTTDKDFSHGACKRQAEMTRTKCLAGPILRRLCLLGALALLMCGRSYATAETNQAGVRGMTNVERIIAAKRDILGEAAMRRPNGASYELFADAIPPLRYTNADLRCYPFALSAPGSKVKARLASDGSAINARGNQGLWHDVGFPVTFSVAGDETFGSDLGRLTGPQYREGYLPVVGMSYKHAGGEYVEEFFVSTESPYAERAVVFCRFSLGSGDSGPISARVDLDGVTQASAGRLADAKGRLAVAFSGNWKWDAARRELDVKLAPGREAYLAVFTDPAEDCPDLSMTRGVYERQLRACARTWNELLGRAVLVETPEPRVNNAWRALIIGSFQLLKDDNLCYSAGNGYERLFGAECGDAVRSLLLWGCQKQVTPMLIPLLDYQQIGVGSHDAGFKLQLLAHYYWLTRDSDFVKAQRGRWIREVDHIVSGREADTGLMPRENYCGDIETQVYSLNVNANCWRGLRDIAAVLDDMGDPKEAQRLAGIARDYRKTVIEAVEKSERRDVTPPFIPNALFGEEQPYDKLTETMLGSYWDLMIPYVLGSGLFEYDSERATWILDYLHQHGGVCMGLIRFYWNSTDDLYGLRYVLALLQRDEVERSVVSFYGKLAQGLTHDTFLGGEGCALAPIDQYGRHAHLPPNSASNALLLWHLRYMLVQDWDMDDDGTPDTLRLLFATPRRWLQDGRRIDIERAPTAFGQVSVKAESRLSDGNVTVTVHAPPRAPKRMMLRVRVPDGWKAVSSRIGRETLPVDASGAVDITGKTGAFTVRFEVSR